MMNAFALLALGLPTFAALANDPNSAPKPTAFVSARCTASRAILQYPDRAVAVSLAGTVRWEVTRPKEELNGMVTRMEVTRGGQFRELSSVPIPTEFGDAEVVPIWSPGGSFVMFVAHSGRIRVVDLHSGDIASPRAVFGDAVWADDDIIIGATPVGVVEIDPRTGTEKSIEVPDSLSLSLYTAQREQGSATVVATAMDGRVFKLQEDGGGWRIVELARLPEPDWLAALDVFGAYVTVETSEAARSENRSYQYLRDRVWFVGGTGGVKVPLPPLGFEPVDIALCADARGFRFVAFDGLNYTVQHLAVAKTP